MMMLLVVMAMGMVCRAAEEKVVKPDMKPVVSMVQNAGMGVYNWKELENFVVYDGGAFLDTVRDRKDLTKVTTMEGKLTAEEVAALKKALEDAGKGPAAEDAGTVTFKWVDKDGKEQEMIYTMPGKSPAKELMEKVRALVKAHGTQKGPVKAN